MKRQADKLGSMAIVAMAGQKGGSGKTTLAVTLASEWHRRGHRVLLVDLDPQGTSTTWGDLASELGVVGPTVVGMGDAIRTQLPSMAAAYDHIVIDCPPRAGKRTTGALMVADLVVLPCGPSPADLWALTEALEIVGQAQELRPELQARIAMNSVLSSTKLGSEVIEALAGLDVPTMEAIIHSRVAFVRALSLGQGVTASEPDSLASKEARAFTDEVEGILGMQALEVRA